MPIPARPRLSKEEIARKYWIKPGVLVQHKFNKPGPVMLVMRIDRDMVYPQVHNGLTANKELYDDRGERVPKTVMRGVHCEWYDQLTRRTETKVFHTHELERAEP